ncbi:MAG TPA: oligopeptide/dipeptide ABC transporter ATP-binding protein [Ramlibacter sp.]|nr:oligopeptide/dipeptide ABC transporter ATP-binding protein [Ramlibacter sp.]
MTPATGSLLRVENLSVDFHLRRPLSWKKAVLHAVRDVSFDIAPGETFGLVGESGSGKSTIGRAILQLVQPSAGRILLDGVDTSTFGGRVPLSFRRDVQVVFQDPMSSLNPRQTVRETLAQAMLRHRSMSRPEVDQEVARLVDSVGLASYYAQRLPHELSGGQRQRVAIARALAVRPRLIVCDEPVSALDVSTQAQVINLLLELQRQFRLSYLFIAHNLDVVQHVSHRIGVLYLGRLVETGPAEAVYATPQHPYTRMLLASTLVPDTHEQALRRQARQNQVRSELPSPLSPPPGCPFHTRCAEAIPDCAATLPSLETVAPQRQAACIRIRPAGAPAAAPAATTPPERLATP